MTSTGDPWQPEDDSHIQEWVDGPAHPSGPPAGQATVDHGTRHRPTRRRALIFGIPAAAAVLVAGGLVAWTSTSRESQDEGLVAAPAGSTGTPSSADSGLPDWASPDEDAGQPGQPFRATVLGYGGPGRRGADIRYVQLAPDSGDASAVPAVDSGSPSSGSSEPGGAPDSELVYRLHLVQPVDLRSCGAEKAPAAPESPREALETVIPTGSRVLMIPSAEQGAFLHQIPAAGVAPDQPPPVDSVNEQLVETGTWEPVDERRDVLKAPYRAEDAAVGEVPRRQWSRRSVDAPASVDGRYWPLVVAAANTALTVTPTGDACSSGFAAHLVLLQEQERERRREQREAERRARVEAPEPVYCIDGDGDGICFED